MAEVGAAVFVGRRAHGNEDQFGMVDRIAGLGAEQQAVFLDVVFQHAGKAGLVDGRNSASQLQDFLVVDIDAHDAVAYIGECCCLYQADIACPKNAHVHVGVPRQIQDGCKCGETVTSGYRPVMALRVNELAVMCFVSESRRNGFVPLTALGQWFRRMGEMRKGSRETMNGI
ncbi:hypothetical protein D3C85_988760 [compost metagenome]